jgi:hypothetical protein
MAKRGSIEKALRRFGTPADKAAEIAKWCGFVTKGVNVLDFNTLVVIWLGTPPDMVRGGSYGEKRFIRQGVMRPNEKYAVLVDGGAIHLPVKGIGDINYQAVTRGGRKMDDVLGHQATCKGVTNTAGDALIISASTVDSPAVALGLLAGGLIVKVVAAIMNPEADTRHWGNIPHTMRLVPLKLAPGDHVVALERDGEVFAIRSIELTPRKKLRVLHFRPVKQKVRPLLKRKNASEETPLNPAGPQFPPAAD